MQPLRLIIPGDYWDSQVYAGRLYLFGRSGDIRTLDWDRLISEWRVDTHSHLALLCAFLRSDYLYGQDLKLLFRDSDIKSVVQKKFQELSTTQLQVSKKQLELTTLGHQDNPLPFPHTDSEIYLKTLYVSSQAGLFKATCNKKTKYPVSTRPEKRWDASVFALSASYGRLALAAGDEGLFELAINGSLYGEYHDGREPRNLTQQHCTDCNWAFHSIYGSSHINSGYLAAFRKKRGETMSEDFEREFDRIISGSRIFHGTGYSWGVRDKLCQVHDGRVHVVRYNPWKEDPKDQYEDLGYVKLIHPMGEVISAGVAVFGMVIEYDDMILILPSQGSAMTLRGEPVNWRVFPRSKHYENQLHVIYEDRLEILSFNHDYFVDQREKRSGIQFFSTPPGQRQREDTWWSKLIA